MTDTYDAEADEKARIEAVAGLAVALSKPEASIRAKLAKMGVYKSIKRVSGVTKEKPKTKEEMRDELLALIDPEGVRGRVWGVNWMQGLEKAPKLVLFRLSKTLEELLANIK